MRLPELISQTNDELAFLPSISPALESEFGISDRQFLERIISSTKHIISQCRADRRRKWFELALHDLVKLQAAKQACDDMAADDLVNSIKRYYQSGINNDPHVIDFVVKPDGSAHKPS